MAVSEALRATRRGSLKYDKHWLESGNVSDVLALCSQFSKSVSIKSPSISLASSPATGISSASTASPGLGGIDVDSKASAEKANVDAVMTPSSAVLSSVESEKSEDRREENLTDFDLAILKSESEWDQRVKVAVDNRIRQFQTKWDLYKRQIHVTPSPSIGVTSPRSLSPVASTAPQFPGLFANDPSVPLSFINEDTTIEPLPEDFAEETFENAHEDEHAFMERPPATDWRPAVEELEEELPVVTEELQFEHAPTDGNEQHTEMEEAHVPAATEPPLVQAADPSPAPEPRPVVDAEPRVVEMENEPIAGSSMNVEVISQTTAAPGSSDAVDSTPKIPLSRSDASRFTTTARLAEYKRVVAEYQRWKENYDEFQQQMASGLCSKTADRVTKGIRQELTVAVTTTINLLTKENVKENLTRLGQLLSGKTVVFRDSRLSIQKHPQAKSYCCELIARTLVKQAENVVSVQPDMAYPLAGVAVSLWIDFPEVGQFLRAIITSHCPYMVPYYMPRGENESNQEYFAKLGYQRDASGETEKQHLFLKRMSGICRFWTAIMVTPAISWTKYSDRYSVMRSIANHPLDFGFGWTFLVNLVQLAPRLDITATILLEFLEISSHFLKKVYGKQFEKLLHFINVQFMPEVEATSSAGVGTAASSRLKTFLNSGSKRFVQPTDYPGSWRRCS